MPGTKAGAAKAAATNKKRDPRHYEGVGRKGGVAKVPKGFSMASPEQRSEWGKLGGVSQRTKSKYKKQKSG